MANPIFKMMNGGNSQNGNIISQFQQFMHQMKGRNSDQMLNELVSSGKINQAQLNQVQSVKQQMMGSFAGLKGMFGF